MADEYINLIVYLENTLADYYAKIKYLPRLEGSKEVLEYMEVHSHEHAEIISEIKRKIKKPVVHESAIINFQNNLAKSVFNKISAEKNILSVLQILADSEESVGKLYMSISSLLMKFSVYYRTIAEDIDKIAKEEFDHRDLLLKDKKRLAQKINKN
jgi:hypothetical protein